MPDIKTFEDVPVSGVAFDFRHNSTAAIPHQLYVEWAALVVEVAQEVRPGFEAPPLPASFEFETCSLPSDGPYPASEDYYLYDFSYFSLAGANGEGIQISIESGRQDRGDTVNIDTCGFSYGVSSFIFLSAAAPRATFYVFRTPEQTTAVDDVFARNKARRGLSQA
jgi:hypothetical protein